MSRLQISQLIFWSVNINFLQTFWFAFPKTRVKLQDKPAHSHCVYVMQKSSLQLKITARISCGKFSAKSQCTASKQLALVLLPRLHLSFIPGASLISRRDARLMDFHRAATTMERLLSRHFWVYFLSASIISRRWCVLKSNFPSPIYMQTNSTHTFTRQGTLSACMRERERVCDIDSAQQIDRYRGKSRLHI
jgi:hypothetical protein